MARTTMEISLGTRGVDRMIRALDGLVPEAKVQEFCRRLAEIGADAVRTSYGGTYNKQDGSWEVKVNPVMGGYEIAAQGAAVVYLEYGAGRYRNPVDAPRPAGIDGIGMHQKDGQPPSKGASGEKWFFMRGGQRIYTRGNAAAQGFTQAQTAIEQNARAVAKEVFG